MGGLTLDLQLKINEKEQLQETSLIEINTFVEEVIEKHKTNATAINTLVLDSVAALSIAEARSDELASQGKVKKMWNGLTGKNQKIRGEIDWNLASTQYASQQMIQKLAEQNLLTFELITAVNNRLSSMLNEVEGELNKVFATLITFFKQAKSNIVQFESRIDKIERNVNLLYWHNAIEYHTADGVEYTEMPKMEKIICLVNDFYHLTKGKWSSADRMLLKSTMTEIGLNVKEEVFYRDFFTAIIEKPALLRKLLAESSLEKALAIEPHQATLIKGLEKYDLLQNEERYIVESVLILAKSADSESIVLSLMKHYLKTQAIFDMDKSINVFDFMNELLLNLALFFNIPSTEALFYEEYEEKIEKMQNKIEIQKRELILLNNEKIEAKRRLVKIDCKNASHPIFFKSSYELSWRVYDGELVKTGDDIGSFPINLRESQTTTNKIISPSSGRIYLIKETGDSVKDEEIVAVIGDPEDEVKEMKKWVKKFG